MTYQQLLPVYQQITGKPGQDAEFNQWVQGIINQSGSQAGVEGIPDNFFQTPQGQQYVQSTTTVAPGSVTPNPTASTSGDLNLGNLVQPQGQPQVPSITPLPTGAGPQGYSQNEAGAQTGQYQSQGGTVQTQSGQQTQNTAQQQNTNQQQQSTGQQQTNQQQSGQTATTGTQTDTGTQQTAGTSSTTSSVDLPFDLGGLVNSQIGSATATDASKNAFLTDFMNTGGTGFQSQVDQAIRQSLSGPQMTGAGDSARARAAGYGAAQVARNNAGERLQAASLLGGPTGVTQNVSALSPLFNRTQNTATTGTAQTNNTSNTQQLQNTASQLLSNISSSGTQNTTGSSNTTGQSETMDLQKLVGSEVQSGTAGGQSVSQGTGVAPAGQQVKSGGCVVCTAYVSQGRMKPGAVRRACRYKQANWHRYGTSLTGYLFYGPWIARAVLCNAIIGKLVKPLARAILYEEVRLSAPTRLRFRWHAYVLHGVFDLLSWPVGATMKLLGVDADVRDSKIKAMLVSQNLNFEL